MRNYGNCTSKCNKRLTIYVKKVTAGGVEEEVSATKFPLLDRRGGCAIKKKAAFLAGADGVVDQAPKQ